MTARIESIDKMRGLVMVLMALDHTRDFFGGSGFNPRDVNEPLLFMTRWITHLCAPSFIFLAGVSIYLWQQQGHTKTQTSRFVLLRGLWLIFLEFTWIRVSWTFTISPEFMIAQVIWAIGVAMVIMAAAIYVPIRILALLSAIIIAGHNAFDKLDAEKLGGYRGLWVVLHQPETLTLWDNTQLFVLYPLVPWFAVMSLGYCFGGYFLRQNPGRYCLRFGAASIALFTALRFGNYYGDPAPWLNQGTVTNKILSFINCEKYPPSLLYLLITLGVALLLLAMLEKMRGKLSGLLLVFGRVPLFFYLIHIPLIHLAAVAAAAIKGDDMAWLFGPLLARPVGSGYNLGVVYSVWLAVIVCLYPLCRKYGRLKQRHKDVLSYL